MGEGGGTFGGGRQRIRKELAGHPETGSMGRIQGLDSRGQVRKERGRCGLRARAKRERIT